MTKYKIEFKPGSLKDCKKIPKTDLKRIFYHIEEMSVDLKQEELDDYEDLRMLRKAKQNEGTSSAITLKAAKKRLNL
jgi:mRNA-degrading endonuclease RelE of RelBE toxin-antitoxin system